MALAREFPRELAEFRDPPLGRPRRDPGMPPRTRGGIASITAVSTLLFLVSGCGDTPAPRPSEKRDGTPPQLAAGAPPVFPTERTRDNCVVWATVPSGTDSRAAMARGAATGWGTTSGATAGNPPNAPGGLSA